MNQKFSKIRSFVIESSIVVEEITSLTIKDLLGIEQRSTKSFGFESSSLSFNQKVLIIQDLKGVSKEEKQKFDCLIYIRNKFAHVRKIRTFNDLFETARNGKQTKRNLLKWYENFNKTNLSAEALYKFLFAILVVDMSTFLQRIMEENSNNLGFYEGKRRMTEELLSNLIYEVRKVKNGNEIIENIINQSEENLKKKN